MMADHERMVRQQRQVMGPPETPSRVMQASPTLFPSLQFSPDLFSSQNMSPMTAPIYPQQRLFWDHASSLAQGHTIEAGLSPYGTWEAPFASTSTTVPGMTSLASQDQSYDLPLQPYSAGPFFESAGFPAPFHTSPRPVPQLSENPAEFLSSPARRFGGVTNTKNMQTRRPVWDIPAYHHQMQESKREMELEREKRRVKAAKRADDEMLMSSVRRALTPSKAPKPGLHRSFTHSGVTAPQTQFRRQIRPPFNDSASTSSTTSNLSSHNGRSSPLKRTSSAAGLDHVGSFSKPRTAVTLAIDEHGVAKTVLEDLQESDTDADDDRSLSNASSIDDEDFRIIHSQANSFAFDEKDDMLSSLKHPVTARKSSQRSLDKFGSESAKRMNRLSLSSFSNTETVHKRGLDDTVRPPKRSIVIDTSNEKGDAQRALRAIIQDRSRSASTADGYASSRQSDSSVQFHSSPPIHQGQFGNFSGSPTTMTDPELATPNTDQESFAMGSMHCICNSPLPDNSVVQCQTPMRHPSSRGPIRSSARGSSGGHAASPLAHKSTRAPNYHRSR